MRWPEFRYGMRERGVLPGVWFTVGSNAKDTPADAGFVVVEVEGDSDRHGLVSILPRIPAIPRAIVTNFGGLIVKTADGVTDLHASRARAQPLVDAGFECLTEVYRSENPNATPEGMDFIATRQLGFPRSAPVFGVYGGKTVDDYSTWHSWPGWGVYLAEYL